MGLIADLPPPAVAVAAIGFAYKIWRELPARRMEQLDYLQRLRAESPPRSESEDSRR